MQLSAKKCRQILVFRTKMDDMWGGSQVKCEYGIHASKIIQIVNYLHSAVGGIQDEICVRQAGRDGEDGYAL